MSEETRVRECLAQAAECREIAAGLRTCEEKRPWLLLAREWEHLADHLLHPRLPGERGCNGDERQGGTFGTRH